MKINATVKECKLCNQIQPAYYAGLYGDGKTKKWEDADGKLWNGTTCPGCNVVRARLTMQATRAKRKQNGL